MIRRVRQWPHNKVILEECNTSDKPNCIEQGFIRENRSWKAKAQKEQRRADK